MQFNQFRTFRVAATNLNGQMRSKHTPQSTFAKLDVEGSRMPLSVLNVDIWGADIEDSPLVFASGDEDGVLKPTEHGPVPMPWLDSPSALVPMWMFHDDGRPFAGDPRHALRRVLDRYAERGWTVQAAVEMEFYLVDDTGHQLSAPQNPISGRPVFGNAILSIRQLDAFDAFLTDLYEACDAMDIPADSASSEAGLGQFEINLAHRDAMAAADDAWLFKSLVRGMARRHDMAATFMAKPFPNDAGNGMHVHFSVLDEDGNNIFDDGGPKGTELLRNAVAGCIAGMPGGTLLWAPHGNSYARFAPGAHAPTSACWAYENRTAAIRIPSGPHRARRIEHRVACGDINPYLTLSAILGSALAGIEDGLQPSEPITGNAYDLDLPGIMPDWASAIDRFEIDPVMARIFTPELIQNLTMTKRQEVRRLAELPPEEHWMVYLETV
jgi:glutamine synthetase